MSLLERTIHATTGGQAGQQLLHLLQDHVAREPVHATLKGLVHHGRHARSGFVARNLREQLCVRLSHQVQRLEHFPQQSSSAHHLQRLVRVHVDTFQELHSMGHIVNRIVTGSREHSLTTQGCDPLDDFRRCIDAINNRHAANVETLMEAKREASKVMERSAEAEDRLQSLIDDFLQMHISFQLLCRQFLQVLKPGDSENESGRTGMVAESCSLSDVVADAVGETQLITEHHLTRAPEVLIEGDVEARVTCVPSHVHHILFEVLKNSLRATAIRHTAPLSSASSASLAALLPLPSSLPPVRVRIAQGPRQVSVCVSDEGGGMSLKTSQDAFRYLWTSSETYDEAQSKHRENASFQPANDPLSGMGIGLPVSRLYARHFGGDLGMLSLQGYGTHVALFLPILEDGVEHLPPRPRTMFS